MTLKPQSDYLLCLQKNLTKQEKESNGLFFTEESIPEYEIVDMTIAAKMSSNLHVGDVILSNAVPTKAVVEDKTYFLVKVENAVCKLSE